MTGSKGVGRLAVQFLAKEIGMRTVSEENPNSEIQVYVDWAKAQKAGELTEAIAKYKTVEPSIEYPGGSKHGTAIILSGLNQTWDTNDITELAKEIWPLQPPFRAAKRRNSSRRSIHYRVRSSRSKGSRTFRESDGSCLEYMGC